MGLSIRAYAKRRGVSDKAVRKARDSGRIAAAFLDDGTIDPAVADELWERNTNPDMRRGVERERGEEAVRARLEGADVGADRPADARSALDAHVATRRAVAEPARTTTAQTQVDLAAEERREKIRRIRLANDEKEGKLVDKAGAYAHFFAAMKAVGDAWQDWPGRVGPLMAVDLQELARAGRLDSFHVGQILDRYVREHLEELGGKKEDDDAADAAE
ncbi:hypothetical protein [Salinarimonas rosea]|uniref:hypothetical protein n=1 Tax=Salinarimonas rosea TaxID=552063 RepID=UPI0004202573|nr:hypothetical protein [Salinarimonas rosea]